jgi:hypothetical protein
MICIRNGVIEVIKGVSSGTEDYPVETAEFGRIRKVMEARGWTYIGYTDRGTPVFMAPKPTESEIREALERPDPLPERKTS